MIKIKTMSIPTYKEVKTEQEFNSIVNYCKSWVNHYVAYFQINGYVLTNAQIIRLQECLRNEGYILRDCINSHGVECFWIVK